VTTLNEAKRRQDPVFSNLDEIRIERAGKRRRVEKESFSTSADEPSLASSPAAIWNGSEMTFVHVPPGAFVMGSPVHEPGRADDEIEHEVTLTRGFYLLATPVTQGLWKAVMGTNPSCFKGDDLLPVETVSWHQCQEFLNRLNREGSERYRLPTEAEWEYACRAGTSTPFAGGEIMELFCASDPNLDAMGWYCGNSGRRSRPVGQKKPNAWGLYDMQGNVCEWCQDWYGEYSADAKVDPLGAPSGSGRVIRGGSWFSNAKNCRSASRFYWSPASGADFLGFRLVKESKNGARNLKAPQPPS